MSWFDRYEWVWEWTPCQWAFVAYSIISMCVIFWLYHETKKPPPKS